jgi:hypothetical protein
MGSSSWHMITSRDLKGPLIYKSSDSSGVPALESKSVRS